MPFSDPDKQRQYLRKYHANYYVKNKETIRLTHAAYYKKNKKRLRAVNEAWKKANPERQKELSLASCRRRKYGLTRRMAKDLWTAQEGRCAICRREPLPDETFHLDHDHLTKKNRGFVCRSCNTGLGAFKDRPELMLAAIEYLRHHGVGFDHAATPQSSPQPGEASVPVGAPASNASGAT